MGNNNLWDNVIPEGFRMHLNLSYFAYSIISADMFAFGQEKISPFINKVFINYYHFANASIKYRLENEKETLDELLSNIECDNKDEIISRLIEKKKDELNSSLQNNQNGEQIKIHINKTVSKILSDCAENIYYNKCCHYVKSVIEEYARMLYEDRERIYFYDRINQINQGIREEKVLKITTINAKQYYVYPYKIMTDIYHTANYLVCYAKSENESITEKKATSFRKECSFRIDTLKSVNIMHSKRARLTINDKDKLEKMIAARGVQFVISDEKRIIVQLTENGKNKLRRLIHLRPKLDEIDGDKYIFFCTEAQAEYYFFKFGMDANILEPIDLRNRMMELYEKAINNYK